MGDKKNYFMLFSNKSLEKKGLIEKNTHQLSLYLCPN